jgi:hypothetical protein
VTKRRVKCKNGALCWLKDRGEGGDTEMQKAMELKKKKNLEPTKGNRFSILPFSDLNQMSKDINIKISKDNSESKNIIDTESKRYDYFARDNPELILPVNLDVNCIVEDKVDLQPKPDGSGSHEDLAKITVTSKVTEENGIDSPVSPDCSIKEPNSSNLWTEVVRKGKNRGKYRSRSKKIGDNERGLLKY